MESTIEKKVQEAVDISRTEFEGNSMLGKYEDALKKFKELVENGVIKRRGNNLISITDLHLHRSLFNSSENENFNFPSTNL